MISMQTIAELKENPHIKSLVLKGGVGDDVSAREPFFLKLRDALAQHKALRSISLYRFDTQDATDFMKVMATLSLRMLVLIEMTDPAIKAVMDLVPKTQITHILFSKPAASLKALGNLPEKITRVSLNELSVDVTNTLMDWLHSSKVTMIDVKQMTTAATRAVLDKLSDKVEQVCFMTLSDETLEDAYQVLVAKNKRPFIAFSEVQKEIQAKFDSLNGSRQLALQPSSVQASPAESAKSSTALEGVGHFKVHLTRQPKAKRPASSDRWTIVSPHPVSVPSSLPASGDDTLSDVRLINLADTAVSQVQSDKKLTLEELQRSNEVKRKLLEDQKAKNAELEALLAKRQRLTPEQRDAEPATIRPGL